MTSVDHTTIPIAWYGKPEPLPRRIPLRAGRLSLVYESGFLRYIRLGNREVLRMINHAVRDQNWGTVPLRVFDEQLDKGEDSFRITYQAEAKQGDMHFLWHCLIEGRSDSSLLFTIDGQALSRFRRNRIGFTVLHPVRESSGQPVTIIHPDGDQEAAPFPRLISPNQPFLDIRSMQWPVTEGEEARLDFEGDIFETEDQRNWTDDSFKTYCTPLSRPFPVLVETGDRVRQTVALTIKEQGSQVKGQRSPAQPAGSAVTRYGFSLESSPRQLPRIGIGQSSQTEALTEKASTLLQAASFDHYRVELKLYETNWPALWERTVQEAVALGFPLELCLFFDEVQAELAAFIPALQQHSVAIAIVIVFDRNQPATQPATLEAVAPVLRRLLPRARIGGGTNAFFTELNRNRPPTEQLDFLVYSINPQVHAFDNASLVENLYAQSATVHTARSFADGKAVHVSPVTFKTRWNPNATEESAPAPNQLPDDVDPRQLSLFGAAWTLGTIHELIAGEAAAVTCYETVGLKGLLQSAQPRFAEAFPAPAEAVYPMYFLLKVLLAHKDHGFYPLQPSDPLSFTGLGFGPRGSGATQLILANFTAEAIRVALPAEFRSSTLRLLDAGNVPILMQQPEGFEGLPQMAILEEVELPPFGIGFLEGKEFKSLEDF